MKLFAVLLFSIFAYISSKYSIKMDITSLKKIFGIFTILSGLYIFYNF